MHMARQRCVAARLLIPKRISMRKYGHISLACALMESAVHKRTRTGDWRAHHLSALCADWFRFVFGLPRLRLGSASRSSTKYPDGARARYLAYNVLPRTGMLGAGWR